VINTTPCLLVISFLSLTSAALTSWDRRQATQHSREGDHGVYVTARGSSCCVYEKGEENGVVDADIGRDLGDTGVHQSHAKLSREVD
jgi:hypothetical protein